MKLVINLDNTYVLIPQSACGPLIESLTQSKLLFISGYGSSKKYTIKEDTDIELLMVPDDKFEATPEPLKKLQEEKAESDSRWIEYYNKANEFEKQLKALQTDLDSRGITYTKPEEKK